MSESALEEIEATLGQIGIKWKRDGHLQLRCVEDSRDMLFELRIEPSNKSDATEPSPSENSMKTMQTCYLHLHRLKGEMWEFAELSRRIVEQVAQQNARLSFPHAV